MKVINLQNYGVVVINSKLTKEAILKLAKHAPKALRLINEDGDEIFRIGYGENLQVGKYGIMFNAEDSEGTALITIHEKLSNEEIAEKYAGILLNLKTVENNAVAAYTELENKLLEIAESIETPRMTEEAE